MFVSAKTNEKKRRKEALHETYGYQIFVRAFLLLLSKMVKDNIVGEHFHLYLLT